MGTNKRRFALALYVALASAAAALAAQDKTPVPVDTQLAVARAMYRPDTWPAGPLRAGFALGALELDGFQGAPARGDGARVTRVFRPAADAPPAFHVELVVADDLAGAREQVLAWLAGVSSAEAVPRAAQEGIDVGDVGFVGRSRFGPEHPLWVAFARGNVALRVMAHDLEREGRPSVAAVARGVDAALARERVLAPGEAVPKPTFQAFDAARARVRAGEVLPLTVAARDVVAGEPQLEFVLAGGATGYVERAADGTWLLHTTGPGRLELVAVALGSNGTFGRASLSLEVAPE